MKIQRPPIYPVQKYICTKCFALLEDNESLKEHEKNLNHQVDKRWFIQLFHHVKYAGARMIMNYVKPRQRRHFLKNLPKNSVCAEIGVDQGVFSTDILKYTNPKKLHLIDFWQQFDSQTQQVRDNRYNLVKSSFGELDNVEVHRGDSVKTLNSFPDDYFDWVYVDADHMYDNVIADLKAVYPKVKSGGIIAGDDYIFEGKKWVFGSDGVRLAVDDFIRDCDVELIEIKNRQFIIKKVDAF